MIPNLPENALTSRLWAQDSRKEDERINPDFVHVSTLLKWCAREYALSLRYLKHGVMQKQPSGSDRIVWEIGKAVEKLVRRSLIASYGPENVYCNWFCRCEEMCAVGFGGSHLLSPCCGTRFDVFKEYVIESMDYRLTGSIDFLLAVDGYMIPVEIKSITDSENANKTGMGFSSLKKPIGDHANQVSIYHQLLTHEKTLPLPLADFCIVAYVRKEYQFKTPYKEFRLDMSAASPWPRLAQNLMRQAKQVFSPALPARVCKDAGCYRAKGCNFVQACFSS